MRRLAQRFAGAARGRRKVDLDQRVRRIATKRARAVVRDQKSRIDSLDSAAAVVRVDLEQIANQLRAIEHRLDSAVPIGGAVVGTPDEVAEARNVLDEVRAEHERMRVRMTVALRYEERLRRIEEAVVTLYGGDLRGPGPDAKA